MLWRVLDTGVNEAAVNMAVDEAIMLAHGAGMVPPTLRFYSWRPAALSLGYFQKAQAEVDLEACARQGVDVVRRLTGGRAVLHDAELTYSLIVREDDPLVPPTITASYRYFSGGIVTGLAALGIEAAISMPKSAYGKTGKQAHSSAACFDAPSHYEILYEGRKLVGSAQVRKNGVILQHGSLLLRFQPEKLTQLLNIPSETARQRLTAALTGCVASLESVRKREVDGACVRDALAAGFSTALGITLQQGALTETEQQTSEKLAAEKYRRSEWTLRR